MPSYVVDRVANLLNERKKCIRDAKILLLGVAYKRDVADIRESPALEILTILHQKGADVTYHDPLVPSFTHLDQEWRSQSLDASTLRQQDCVVIVTDHACFDYDAVLLT